MLLWCNIDGALTEVQNSTHRANNSNINPCKCLFFKIINLVKLHSHILTFTHSAWRLILFSWACLSKLASCPCVEHAHQTSSTPPIWHMHARHVQWHPHNTELAGERIHFPVRYSTDVCFNFFLIERLRYSINHTQAKKEKKKTQAKWKMSKSEYSVGRQRNPHEQQYWQSHVEPFRGEAARLLIHSRANKTPKMCFFYFATSHSGTLLLLIPGKCYMCFTSYMLISVRL